jgi:hypothetical protein
LACADPPELAPADRVPNHKCTYRAGYSARKFLFSQLSREGFFQRRTALGRQTRELHATRQLFPEFFLRDSQFSIAIPLCGRLQFPRYVAANWSPRRGAPAAPALPALLQF